MRKYKIGEMSKMLDVPVETIRFLEQKGLITPERNAHSGYRYYDIWDANQILDYKKYRQIDFSSKETVEIVKSGNLDKLIDQVEEKRLEAVLLSQYYRSKAMKFHNFQVVLSSIQQMLGKYLIMNRPDHYSFYTRSYDQRGLHTIALSTAGDGLGELMENYPFVEHIYRIKQDWFQEPGQPPEAQFGFSIKKQWADAIGLKNMAELERVRSVSSVFTIVRIGEKQLFSPELLDGAFQFMRENHYQLNGDITGIYLATVQEDSQNMRYLEIWVPIKADESSPQSPFASEDSSYSPLRHIFA